MKNFTQDVYMKKFYHLLDKRKETFRKTFEYLDSLNKENYTIIETGICRIENNFVGDGMSSIMYDEFINYYDGSFITIDIEQKNIEFAKNKLSDKTTFICEDSVKSLNDIVIKGDINNIDLLYLDSFDLDWNRPHNSSMHHMKEFISIRPIISPGTLIVVDDNNKNTGKGKYIDEYMTQIGKKKYFDEYQIGWIY